MFDDPAALFYTGNAGQQYHDVKRSIPEAAIPWVANLRAKKFSPHVGATDIVFEFGVGSGWNLAKLHCARRVGYDISTFLKPLVEKQGIEFISDLASVPKTSIDVVLCHHTLEHLIDPSAALEQIAKLLVPEGKLLLYVPFEKERRYRRYTPGEPNHHLYSWSVQTLGNLVEQVGFKVVAGKIGRFGYDRFAANWAARFNLGESGFRLVRSAVHLVKPACEVRIVAVKK